MSQPEKRSGIRHRIAYRHYTSLHRIDLLGMLIAGAVIGLIVAVCFQSLFGPLGWLHIHPWVLVAIEIGILIGIKVGSRKEREWVDKLSNERVSWLRGGQAEELVGWYLDDLPRAWHVFHNVKLWKNGDLDHVLIGPGGIFCISTKSSRGIYAVDSSGRFLLNGEETPHVHDAQILTMQFRDRLVGILGDVPWIQAALIVPFAYIDFHMKQQHVWVLHEGNLNEIFETAARKLDATEIQRVAKAVRMIAHSASDIYVHPQAERPALETPR